MLAVGKLTQNGWIIAAAVAATLLALAAFLPTNAACVWTPEQVKSHWNAGINPSINSRAGSVTYHNTTGCSFVTSIAVFSVHTPGTPAEPFGEQTLFSTSPAVTVPAHGHVTVSAPVPTCNFQIDYFYGGGVPSRAEWDRNILAGFIHRDMPGGYCPRSIPLPECRDGIDNDGDGLIDLADPGCSNGDDDDEDGEGQANTRLTCTAPSGFIMPPGAAVTATLSLTNGTLLSGAQVTWSDPAGLGSVNPTSSSTNSNGQATTTYQVPSNLTQQGSETVTARFAGTTAFEAATCTVAVSARPTGGGDVPECRDGIDNDGDGRIDLNDPGCTNSEDDDEGGEGQTPECRDGIDNDGDGAIDLNDFSCSNSNDDDETNPRAQCQDGIDNDGDGLVDLNDPGCTNRQDNNETNGGGNVPECRDGIDNDGDGLVDLNDPGCSNGEDDDENGGGHQPQCRDGIDNDGDGAVDMNDFSCNNTSDNDETNPRSQCQDGIDNDNDGRIDLNDPGCSNRQDNSEDSEGTSGTGGQNQGSVTINNNNTNNNTNNNNSSSTGGNTTVETGDVKVETGSQNQTVSATTGRHPAIAGAVTVAGQPWYGYGGVPVPITARTGVGATSGVVALTLSGAHFLRRLWS